MKKNIVKLAVCLFLVVGIAGISMSVSAEVSPLPNSTYDVYIPSWEPMCDSDCRTQCDLSNDTCSNSCDGVPEESICKQGCRVEHKGCVRGCGC